MLWTNILAKFNLLKASNLVKTGEWNTTDLVLPYIWLDNSLILASFHVTHGLLFYNIYKIVTNQYFWNTHITTRILKKVLRIFLKNLNKDVNKEPYFNCTILCQQYHFCAFIVNFEQFSLIILSLLLLIWSI